MRRVRQKPRAGDVCPLIPIGGRRRNCGAVAIHNWRRKRPHSCRQRQRAERSQRQQRPPHPIEWPTQHLPLPVIRQRVGKPIIGRLAWNVVWQAWKKHRRCAARRRVWVQMRHHQRDLQLFRQMQPAIHPQRRDDQPIRVATRQPAITHQLVNNRIHLSPKVPRRPQRIARARQKVGYQPRINQRADKANQRLKRQPVFAHQVAIISSGGNRHRVITSRLQA